MVQPRKHSQRVILHLHILRWLIFTHFSYFTDVKKISGRGKMAFSHLFHFSGHLIIEETFGEENGTLNYISNIKGMSMKQQH